MLIIKSIQLITLQFWTYMGCQEPTCRCQMANVLKLMGLLASSVGTCACIELSRVSFVICGRFGCPGEETACLPLLDRVRRARCFSFQKSYKA